MSDILIRDMGEGDLGAAHGLSRAEAWPHRPEDWQLLLSVGRGVAAVLDGTLVGTTIGIPHGDAASIGMVIVSPSCQGRGIGRRLMDAVMQRLGNRRFLLCATEAGMPLYRRLGFATVGTVHQIQGIAAAVPEAAPGDGEALRPIVAPDLPALAALDRAASGLDRPALLAELFRQGSGVVLERGGALVGFAILRPFGRGDAIGPVVADTPRGARALIANLLGRNLGRFTRVDVTGEAGLPDWLAGADLARVGGGTLMSTAPASAASSSYVALVSQALG